jgi:hypothetical protein
MPLQLGAFSVHQFAGTALLHQESLETNGNKFGIETKDDP